MAFYIPRDDDPRHDLEVSPARAFVKSVPWVLWFFLFCLFVGLLSGGYFLVSSRFDNAVVQPQQRQNLDQNASQRRADEAAFRADYATYQNEVQAVALDQQNLTAFTVANGAPASYPPYSQVANEYQQLFQALTQDQQAEVNAAHDYNALATNADTGPYRPSDLPASLAVGS